jgi:hypothetical protein
VKKEYIETLAFHLTRGLFKASLCFILQSQQYSPCAVRSSTTTLRRSLVLLMDLKTSHKSPLFVDPLSSLALPSAVMSYTTPASFPSSGLYLNTPKKNALPKQLEEVRAAGWLDLMMASSPPRKRQSKDLFPTDVQADDLDLRYRNWMVCI